MESKWLLVIVGVFAFFFILAGIVVLALVSEELTPKVGVIYIRGEIAVDDSSGFLSTTHSSREIVKLIKEADNDPSVKVILLDINSPGGSVVGSKEIAYAVRDCKKPVVAYISELGASGAYYIAAASDLVVADEDSLTGSIGTVMILENYHELLKNLGINFTVLKKGKYKDMANPFEANLTSEEKEMLQSILDDAYSHFIRDLKEFRGGKIDLSVADGRIMTGEQARQHGLVDELGTREYAIKRAWELANQTGKPETKDFRVEKPFLEELLSSLSFGKPPSASLMF